MNMMLSYWHRLHFYPTEPEVALEPAIAALGERYRSQHLFLKYKHVADFVLLDRKLVIEVDGSSHQTLAQKYKDLKHMIALQAEGFRVVRVTNEEAVRNPEATVARAIQDSQTAPPDYEEALAQLHLDYPEQLARLSMPAKRKPRRRKAPGPASGQVPGLEARKRSARRLPRLS